MKYDTEIKVGDVLTMKKKHPCGSTEFEVTRIGMDLKLRCRGCGRELMIPRNDALRHVRRVASQASGKTTESRSDTMPT